jgi:hypothetical protein
MQQFSLLKGVCSSKWRLINLVALATALVLFLAYSPMRNETCKNIQYDIVIQISKEQARSECCLLVSCRESVTSNARNETDNVCTNDFVTIAIPYLNS